MHDDPALLQRRRRRLLQQEAQPDQQRFLEAVRQGDILGLRALLQEHPRLDVNCCDLRGRRALETAVQQADVDMVAELLKLPAISVEHLFAALLVAIEKHDVTLALMLLQSDTALAAAALRPDAYPNIPVHNMTPIMAAAIEGDLEMTKMLLDNGHSVLIPHDPGCTCPECGEKAQKDGEQLSRFQLRHNAYRALCSPVYIILTSDDPVLTAFELSGQLRRVGYTTPEFQEEYGALSQQCSEFAAALLAECRDTDEVEAVLSQSGGFPSSRPFRFPRLYLAIVLGQKSFVAQPSCQQVLRALWTDGLPQWGVWSPPRKALHVALQALLAPVWLSLYLVLPNPHLVKPLQVPLHRFIYCCGSYTTFLCLLTVSLFYGRRDSLKMRALWSEILVGIWVVGYAWELALNAWALGLRLFLRSWWALYDLAMLALFLIAEVLWFIVFVTARTLQENLDRTNWPWYHPYLIGEALYAVATVLAFCRLLLWCQMHRALGPLGVSLACMLGDVMRFLLVILVVIFAFAAGLNSIYKNYAGNVSKGPDGSEKTQPDNFTTLGSAFMYLFWAIYELSSPEYGDIVVPGKQQHGFTEFIGYALWATYHVITVIVLLNAIIAMMTDSYQRVQGNAYTEWVFARSSQWISYFDLHSSVPPPFNLFPAAHCMRFSCIFLYALFRSKKDSKDHTCGAPPHPQWSCFEWEIERNIQKRRHTTYQDLVVRLGRRYLQNREIEDRRQSRMSTLDRSSFGENISERRGSCVVQIRRKFACTRI
ncbi:short transient receptor potential channel 4-like [Ornithodoros turicata]